MANVKMSKSNMPMYEVWRFVNSGYHITRRSSYSSADDEFIARDLTDEEMWAMVRVIEQPAVISISTKPYASYKGEPAWDIEAK